MWLPLSRWLIFLDILHCRGCCCNISGLYGTQTNSNDKKKVIWIFSHCAHRTKFHKCLAAAARCWDTLRHYCAKSKNTCAKKFDDSNNSYGARQQQQQQQQLLRNCQAAMEAGVTFEAMAAMWGYALMDNLHTHTYVHISIEKRTSMQNALWRVECCRSCWCLCCAVVSAYTNGNGSDRSMQRQRDGQMNERANGQLHFQLDS